jgi:hypothetical protein
VIFSEVACLSIAHLTHFLSGAGAIALHALKFLKSLLGFNCADITKKALNDGLDGCGGTVGVTKPGIVTEGVLNLDITTADGVPETGIYLLPEIVLLITSCCLVLNGKSVKFLEVLISLVGLRLLMEGPISEKLADAFLIGSGRIAIRMAEFWQLPDRGLRLANVVLDDQKVVCLMLYEHLYI